MVGLLVVAFAAGGPLAVGLLGVARTAPAIVTGPMAGLLASRSHPTSLLRVVHVARAAASAALTVWVTMGLPFWGVLILLVLAALAGSLVRPLQLAAMPSLARDPGELVAANVVMSTGEGVGAFVGPLVAGLAVAVSGPPVAVGIATLVFVVGAFSILGLRPGADTQSELRAQALAHADADRPSGAACGVEALARRRTRRTPTAARRGGHRHRLQRPGPVSRPRDDPQRRRVVRAARAGRRRRRPARRGLRARQPDRSARRPSGWPVVAASGRRSPSRSRCGACPWR